MIKTVNLTKSFDTVKALDNVNINVKKGSVYGLAGPNGAGKTTLIKTLLSIYNADSGEITINGEKDINAEYIKQKVIYISDDLYFFSSYLILIHGCFIRSTMASILHLCRMVGLLCIVSIHISGPTSNI